MTQFKELVGSIIYSFLGPNKSNKILIQDEEFSFVRCPLFILQNTQFQDPLGTLVEETLLAHHNVYGCSTLTLLTMWHLWTEEFKLVLEEGYKIEDIIQQSQSLLENVVSQLSDIVLDINTFLSKKPIPMKISNRIQEKKNIFNQVPITLKYSSRHFSPSQTLFSSEDPHDNGLDQGCKLDESQLDIIVKNLDHDEDVEIQNLVLECWKKQHSFSGSFRFKMDGLLIYPVVMPSSSSAVLDGLLIKSNLNQSSCGDRKKAIMNRGLIVNGSVTYEYVHLGFSPNVSISVHQTTVTHRKEVWRQKTCQIIKQLNLNVLIVREGVDPDVVAFCSSHSICVLNHIPEKAFKMLCSALQYSPCTYISDCKEGDIIEGMTIEDWKPFDTLTLTEQYILISIPSTNILQTIVLCSPSEAVIKKSEHQIVHLMSRLSLSSKNHKLLPGGGKTEEWCGEYLKKKLQSEFLFDQNARIVTALLNGFTMYTDLISKKKCLSRCEVSSVLDEMSSKVNAWRSALSLVLLTLQYNTVIINELEDAESTLLVNTI